MKMIVADAATLSLADGSRFTLEPGIHDATDFPDAVKKHWAFSSYVRQVDESEVDQQNDTGLSTQLVKLQSEVADLTVQLTERDTKIGELQSDVADLTAQLAAISAPVADEQITGTSEASESDSKNAKKQQTAK